MFLRQQKPPHTHMCWFVCRKNLSHISCKSKLTFLPLALPTKKLPTRGGQRARCITKLLGFVLLCSMLGYAAWVNASARSFAPSPGIIYLANPFIKLLNTPDDSKTMPPFIAR